MTKRRVCVCTSYPADREPRGPRHAKAVWDTGGCADLAFVDAAPIGATRQNVASLSLIGNLRWHTHHYPTRANAPAQWLLYKLRHKMARGVFKRSGWVQDSALSPHLNGFERLIARNRPEVIVAHNIDTLLPAYRVAQRLNAKLIFDSMEFHSDMGDEQDQVQMELITKIEQLCLPTCALITTSSARVAEALHDTYALSQTLPLYNTPRTVSELPLVKVAGFSLYWRNSTIGLGQRGLAEGIHALSILPEDITLHVQGRLPPDGGQSVRKLAESLGVSARVMFESPYKAENAVQEASRFHIGLCMERRGSRNHELTVSNKMFDYHMAGLAVVSSDLPALRDVLERSNGGLVFEPGNVMSLAAQIRRLYDDRNLYQEKCGNARAFALREGNLETEMARFSEAMRALFASP